MPSYRDLMPDKWLTSDHLKGKTVTITITEVTVEQMYNNLTKKQENRLAAAFAGRSIRLPLNKTNAKAMERITGTDDYSLWRNIRVTLTPGRAQNGKGTILISAAPPLNNAAPPTVHGPEDEEPVHGPQNPEPVHGRAEEEEPGVADPKSGGADSEAGAETGDAIFFTPADLQAKIRELHGQSGEPMTEQQHAYITRNLQLNFGRPGEEILSAMLGRPVNAANPAGALVGRYLYELIRTEKPLPDESKALMSYTLRMPETTT